MRTYVSPERVYTGGRCRYCGKLRPSGYTVTCGNSDCQEAAYYDPERGGKRKRTKTTPKERAS